VVPQKHSPRPDWGQMLRVGQSGREPLGRLHSLPGTFVAEKVPDAPAAGHAEQPCLVVVGGRLPWHDMALQAVQAARPTRNGVSVLANCTK
jgi:hypothetical protein